MRGYCQLDDEGRVVCADQEFKQLLEPREVKGAIPSINFLSRMIETFSPGFSQADQKPAQGRGDCIWTTTMDQFLWESNYAT
jgi:hypothetical protein